MPYRIDDKLVIAIASSALFDLSESDRIYRSEGIEAYREHQRAHETGVLEPGVAFPFVRRLLSLKDDDAEAPIEVILVSRNDADTGLRVMNSIEHHGLDITRAAFLSGRSPARYVRSFSASLFLSADFSDVKEVLVQGQPAGMVLDSTFVDDPTDRELRIAFDFDGVLVDDEAERVYQDKGLSGYHESERAKARLPLNAGPLHTLLTQIAGLQQREQDHKRSDPSYEPRVVTAIITARNAPAHARLVHTLRSWGITVDLTFMLGGLSKEKILAEFKPHIFFDDQMIHLDTALGIVPSVHVPFGILNEDAEE